MLAMLWNTLFFLISLGLLVAVHEYGHFWVARKLGVPVLRFSLGFGPVLWRRQGKDETEYVVSAIPLGGYVKLLDEREGEVPEHLRARAFNRQSLRTRMAVVSAGPLFNFAFAVLVFALMFMVGVTDTKAVLAPVAAETPAARAGFQGEMEIVAVAETPVQTWEQFTRALLAHLGDKQELPVTVMQQGERRHLSLPASALQVDDNAEHFFQRLGLLPAPLKLPPIVGSVVEDGPAARAGVRAGDVVLKVDEHAVADWRELSGLLRERGGKTVTLALRRGEQMLTLELQVRLQEEAEGSRRGVIGVMAAPPTDLIVVRHGPFDAFIAGLRETGATVTMMLTGIRQLVTGAVSVQTLSGPLAIAEGAGATASIGLERFLQFLGFLSVNLGLVNLLPIPMLDGGHLLFYVAEAVRGRPLSERVQEFGMRLGLSLVLALMMIALYNDFARLL